MQFFGVEMTAEDIMTAMDWEADHPEDRIVLISDIWLDQASHMAMLEAILSGQLPLTWKLDARPHTLAEVPAILGSSEV